MAINCLHGLVSEFMQCSVALELCCQDWMVLLMSAHLIAETVKLCALRAECNHSPPIWNNEVWRVIVKQVASWESLQDCTWRVMCTRRRVSLDAHPDMHALTNTCRLNPINANSKPKWHLQQRNEKFSRNLRLIINCKFAVMPVIRGAGTVGGARARNEGKPAASLSTN